MAFSYRFKIANHAAAGEPLPDVHQILVDGGLDDSEFKAQLKDRLTEVYLSGTSESD